MQLKHMLERFRLCKWGYLSYQKYKAQKLFEKEFYSFNTKSRAAGVSLASDNDIYSCLNDKTTTTSFDAHYIYHPAWAARILAKTKPKKHIDISSIINFSAYVSAFIPIEYYEYRPVDLGLSNLKTLQIDILNMPFLNASVESLSCMHVIEHIGLGRYGDAIDPLGDVKAIEEIKRVMKVKGNVLFVVPVGKAKIMFNAHRIYSYKKVLDLFEGFTLKEFALIPDDVQANGLIYNASQEMVKRQNYACGCFWFEKE